MLELGGGMMGTTMTLLLYNRAGAGKGEKLSEGQTGVGGVGWDWHSWELESWRPPLSPLSVDMR